MKLDEAKDILQIEVDGIFLNYSEKLREATKLDIEALKHLQTIRKNKGGGWAHRLPGETE